MSTNLQKPTKGQLNLGLLHFFFCDTPAPRKNFLGRRDSIGSQDQLLSLPNPYFKLLKEQCASYILYKLPFNTHTAQRKILNENSKGEIARFDKKGNQVWQKRKSGLTKKEIRFGKRARQDSLLGLRWPKMSWRVFLTGNIFLKRQATL